MFPPWFFPVTFVFVGCCLNVIFLEYIVREDSKAGNLVTFCQFLFVGLEGLFYHVKRGEIGNRIIPLRHYMGLVGLFFLSSILNNFVFGFNISLPLHMIFRSGSLVTNMVLGMLMLKKRYSFSKIFSVIMITIGITVCTLASSNPQPSPSKSASSSSLPSSAQGTESALWFVGILILIVCLFISSLVGIYQELLNQWYGKSWRESLFYTHFLAIPGFLVIVGNLLDHIHIFNSSPNFSFNLYLPLPNLAYNNGYTSITCSTAGVTSSSNQLVQSALSFYNTVLQNPHSIPISECTFMLPISRLWFFMLLNAITQYICVRGVFELTSVTGSLVVTLTVTLRKFTSIILSILYFKNDFTNQHWIGTLLLFIGTLIFLDLTPWRDSRNKVQKTTLTDDNSQNKESSTSSTSTSTSTSILTSTSALKIPMIAPIPATSPLRGKLYYFFLLLVTGGVSTIAVTVSKSTNVAMIANLVSIYIFSSFTKVIENVYGNSQLPSFGFIIARAFLTVTKSKPSKNTVFEQIEITAENMRIPQSDLKAFRSVCKYNTPGARALENLCFLEMITLPLQGLIITHPRFPISAFGLIHVGNDKILYEAVELTPSKTFNLSASIKGYRWIENHGLEIQVLMVVKSSESNSIVWQCVTTLLSRADAKKVAKSSKDERSSTIPPSLLEKTLSLWSVPANTGLEYAKASGDYSPHHLYPWTAKFIGFSKPIAHGMYSISRCLAELGEHYLDSSSSATISYPLIVSVQFKKPLFLPANDVRLVHDIHDITTTNGGDDSSNENNLVGLDSSAITHCSELLGFEDHNNNNNNNDDTKKCLSFALLSSTGAPHLKAVAYPWNYTKPTTTK